MTNKALVQVLLLWMCAGLAGCNDPRAPSLAATAPSPIPQPVSPMQPTVTAITPNTGSTAGGAWGTITGARFRSGATVRLGIDRVQAYVQDERSISFWGTTSQPAGTVDVVVTNPGGLSSNLGGGYTFAPPESFDFTGDWVAQLDGRDESFYMRFTIRDNVLVSLTCGSSEPVALSPAPSVHNGEFSFLADDGIAIAGRLVSPVNAVGTVNVPGCTMTGWWADKSGAFQTARAR